MIRDRCSTSASERTAPHWHKVDGLPAALGKDGVCSNYAYQYVDSTWQFLRGMREGRAIFTNPNTPVKCGGAPQKIMWLAEHHFRRTGVRDQVQVTFATAGASIFGVKKYREALEKLVVARHIDTRGADFLAYGLGGDRERRMDGHRHAGRCGSGCPLRVRSRGG